MPDVVVANAGVSVGTLTEEEGDLRAFERVMRTPAALTDRLQLMVFASMTVLAATMVQHIKKAMMLDMKNAKTKGV